MKLTSFIKDKAFFIVAQTLIVLFVSFFLKVLHVNTSANIFICLLISLSTIITLVYEYTQKSSYYKNMYKTLNQMDKKQYIFNLLEYPNFQEAKILYEVVKQTTKAMNDEISKHKLKSDEYKEYIETWIHEVKTPIAGIALLCENNKNDITKNILDENNRIEVYVEQALYYARSTNLEKDYIIKEISLNDTIKKAIKKHSKQLIACRTNLNITDSDFIVYSDPKWLEFILGQIISNSIKYRKEKLNLTFEMVEDKFNVSLKIKDNGIGILQKDISRVFQKGFTGENGRKYAKSTGIGLYLCKELSNKMYLGFEIESSENIGTTVIITFPKDKLAMLTK